MIYWSIFPDWIHTCPNYGLGQFFLSKLTLHDQKMIKRTLFFPCVLFIVFLPDTWKSMIEKIQKNKPVIHTELFLFPLPMPVPLLDKK